LVDLSNNAIGDAGAVALGGAVQKSKSLQCLDLRSNEIGDIGAMALAAAVQKSTSLRSLSLDGRTRLGETAFMELCHAVQRSMSLETIEFQNPALTERMKRAFVLARARRGLFVLTGAGVGKRNVGTPVGRFARHDGDHAIMTRVMRFLLDVRVVARPRGVVARPRGVVAVTLVRLGRSDDIV
jgi:hypothetical protein